MLTAIAGAIALAGGLLVLWHRRPSAEDARLRRLLEAAAAEGGTDIAPYREAVGAETLGFALRAQLVELRFNPAGHPVFGVVLITEKGRAVLGGRR